MIQIKMNSLFENESIKLYLENAIIEMDYLDKYGYSFCANDKRKKCEDVMDLSQCLEIGEIVMQTIKYKNRMILSDYEYYATLDYFSHILITNYASVIFINIVESDAKTTYYPAGSYIVFEKGVDFKISPLYLHVLEMMNGLTVDHIRYIRYRDEDMAKLNGYKLNIYTEAELWNNASQIINSLKAALLPLPPS